MKVSAVIAAAGQGRRMGAGINKVYLELFGKSVLEHTVSVFEKCEKIDEIIVVTDDVKKCRKMLKDFKKIKSVVLGGKTRGESVQNGLMECGGELVAIHDGARALIREKEIIKVIEEAEKYGASAVGVKCKDTLKTADKDGFIEGTADREFMYQIQTPQVFKTSEIKRWYKESKENFTDDCALAERNGKKIKIVDGSYENIKLTTPEDLIIAENIMKKRGAEK